MAEQLIDLPPRGLALLHACQPQAREQIEALSDIVVASRIRRPALNILCSGDFGWDPQFVAGLVRKYSQGGRIAHVLFYLTNGPASRHWKEQNPDGFGSRIAPRPSAAKSLTMPPSADRSRTWRRDWPRCSSRSAGPAARPAFVPQLEDNQSNRSFAAMVELVKKSLPPGTAARLGRNPCVGCWPGNEGRVPDDVSSRSTTMPLDRLHRRRRGRLQRRLHLCLSRRKTRFSPLAAAGRSYRGTTPYRRHGQHLSAVECRIPGPRTRVGAA